MSVEDRHLASRPEDGGSPHLPTRREALRWTSLLWALATGMVVVTLGRSQDLGIPLRDPDGRMFRDRIGAAVVLLALLALAEALVRAFRRPPLPGEGAARRLVRAVRDRWTARRTWLVLSGLFGYHVVYVCYRNLKSWNAFNGDHDTGLLALDRSLFLGHSPAVLLHDLLGQDTAAVLLAGVYRSFTYLIPLAVVGTLALLPRVRDAYVMLFAGVWVWILGVLSYYLVPSIGPFAEAGHEFAALRPTAITTTQTEYVAERTHLLTDPRASDAFASIGALASLHVAFTCVIVLVTAWYGWRGVATVLGVYLAAVIVSTVYFGWHYVTDDLAGIAIAVVAVGLALLMVTGRLRPDRGDVVAAAQTEKVGAP